MNYSTTEKETLAIFIAFEKYRPYLLGEHFTTATNYQA